MTPAPEVLGAEDPREQPTRADRARAAAVGVVDDADRAFLALVLVIGATVLFGAGIAGLAVRIFISTSGLGG